MSRAGVNLNRVQDYLKGVRYPCDKQDLKDYAESHAAPNEVLQVLEEIPEREYQSAGDVARGIGNIH